MNQTLNEQFDLGQGTLVRETEKAVLVRVGVWGDVWIPKSQLHEDSEVFGKYKTMPGGGTSGKVIVKMFFAVKSGWAKEEK